MNLNLLESFLSLSESLNFTSTAKKLGVTQPSVSRQIRLLEEQLGVQLFFRDKHQVRLTKQGAELKVRLAPLLDQMAATLSLAREKALSLSGNLRVGSLPEVGNYFFMQHFIEFQKKYSEIDMHIVYALNAPLFKMLREGELDFIIVSENIDSENIRSYHLLEEHQVLVTRAQNKVELRDPRRSSFVGYDAQDALLLGFLKKHFSIQKLESLNRLNIVNSHHSMIDYLKQTDSFAVLPYFSVQQELKQKNLKLAHPESSKTNLYGVHMEANSHLRRNTLFRKWMLEVCKNRQNLLSKNALF